MPTVMNLATGETREYTCPPEHAVVCAHEQTKHRGCPGLKEGNWHTWDYDFSQAIISASGRTVRCGDWAALTGGRA